MPICLHSTRRGQLASLDRSRSRCLVPLTRFAEPRGKGQGNQWFAPADGRPMFFAGIEVRGWRPVRKVKHGETVDDLFAFLTEEPSAEVGAIHP